MELDGLALTACQYWRQFYAVKNDSCHNINFVVTGGTASCYNNSSAASDDKVDFQILRRKMMFYHPNVSQILYQHGD